MTCETAREALSAQLDGEEQADERAAVDTHLAGCADCRQWLDAAARVTRLARTSPAPPVAPLGPAAMAAVLAAAPGRGRSRLVLALRVLLGALGTVQLLLALVQVLAIGPEADHLHGSSTPGGATPDHLWHESAAWNVAVGAGFLWIARRRTRPGGIVPTLTAFIVVLSLLSVVDIAAGRVEPVRLVSHGLILAGYLIVLTLARPGFTTGGPRPEQRSGISRYRVRFDEDDDQTSSYAGPHQQGTGAPAARSTRHIAA